MQRILLESDASLVILVARSKRQGRVCLRTTTQPLTTLLATITQVRKATRTTLQSMPQVPPHDSSTMPKYTLLVWISKSNKMLLADLRLQTSQIIRIKLSQTSNLHPRFVARSKSYNQHHTIRMTQLNNSTTVATYLSNNNLVVRQHLSHSSKWRLLSNS